MFIGWRNVDNVYTTRFEKLVGPKGGGTKQEQDEEIKRIANFFNIQLSQTKLRYITNNLFGVGKTFRQGKMGAWKSHFTKEQKDTFKKVAGQLLIDLGYERNFDW